MQARRDQLHTLAHSHSRTRTHTRTHARTDSQQHALGQLLLAAGMVGSPCSTGGGWDGRARTDCGFRLRHAAAPTRLPGQAMAARTDDAFHRVRSSSYVHCAMLPRAEQTAAEKAAAAEPRWIQSSSSSRSRSSRGIAAAAATLPARRGLSTPPSSTARQSNNSPPHPFLLSHHPLRQRFNL